MDRTENTQTALPIGLEVVHNGQDLRIVELVNISGWTSEVYRGELAADLEPTQTAVKVMKALDLPMARQLFEQEGLTLAAMMFHEEEANKEQRLSLKVAPEYFGRFEYNDMPCLVMEFVKGESIPDLLEKAGRLPEPRALTIAWHLYRTLDILHTRLKKTYIDLKFENLRWVQGESSERGQLKLLDFGTLEDIKAGDPDPRGVHRDLLLGGVYLCGMLTGYMLDYSLGRLRERADPLLDRAEMSWGARQLLRRLLHRNPQVRPTSAALVASELRTLVNYWEQPLERLFEIADTNLSRALAENDQQGERAREHASRARAALDLVRMHPGFDEERLGNAIRRVEDILELSDYVTRGRALFDGRTYSDARQIFEQGMHWSDTPARLRRWAYLARVGQEVTPQVFDQHRDAAVEALERLNQDNLAAAQERLEALEPALSSPGLGYLQADCQLFASLDQAEAAARQEAYQEAAEAYRQALENLERLPDAEFVQREEIGDLLSAAEDMEELQATRGQARSAMEQAAQALQREEDDQAVTLAWQAYWLDWGDRTVQEAYTRLLGQASSTGRLYTARQLSEIGMRQLPAPPWLTALRNQVWLLWQAMQAIQRTDYHNAGVSLRTLYASPELVQIDTTLPAIKKQLDEAGKKASQARDAEGMLQIAEICQAIDFSGHEQWAENLRQATLQIQKERVESQRQTVDRLAARAVQLIALEHPEQITELWPEASQAEVLVNIKGRFDEASSLLQDAARIAAQVDHRQEEVAALQERLRIKKSAHMKADEYRQYLLAQDQETRLAALQGDWDALQAAHENILSRAAANRNPALYREELRAFQVQLPNFIGDCYEYLARHSQEQEIIRQRAVWALNALDRTGADGWQDLQETAAKRLKQLQEQIQGAEKLFNSGELVRAAAAVDSLEAQYCTTTEWQVLKVRVAKAMAWQAWQDDQRAALEAGRTDAELLQALREYGRSDLPVVYRRSVGMQNYVETARSNFRQDARDAMIDYQSPQFFELLRRWRDFEKIAGLLERDSKHDAA